jgi:hypothetical protein
VRDRTLPIAEESCATIRRFRLTLPVKEKGLANPPTRRPHEGPMAPALKRSEEDLTRWVTVQRFDPLGGAPGRELASTCAAIASWAMATTNSEDLSPAMLEQAFR